MRAMLVAFSELDVLNEVAAHPRDFTHSVPVVNGSGAI